MPKNKPLAASVIIANYNSKKFIQDCVKSLIKSNRVTPIEVIIVDNASSDGSREYLKKLARSAREIHSAEIGKLNFSPRQRANFSSDDKSERISQFPNIKVIFNNKNLGPAKARNIGAKAAQSKFLVFLDCDTVVDKNWLKKPLSFFQRHPKVGAAQLKLLQMGSNRFDSAGEKLTPFGFLAERARSAKDIGQLDHVENIFSGKTAAMIVKKDVFQKIGGFDEDLFMYWEEPDLCWRIWKSGYRVVFLPTGKVWHAYGTKDKILTPEHSTWITHQGCRNQIATIIKNGVGLGGARMLLSAIIAWVTLLILFLAKLDFKKAKAVLSAFWWLIKNPKTLWQRRRKLREKMGKSFKSDPLWFSKIEAKRNIGWYLGKGISFVLGKPF